MTQNKCGKCKFFMIGGIKEYICAYHNCKLQGYGDNACNAFEKYKNGDGSKWYMMQLYL